MPAAIRSCASLPAAAASVAASSAAAVAGGGFLGSGSGRGGGGSRLLQPPSGLNPKKRSSSVDVISLLDSSSDSDVVEVEDEGEDEGEGQAAEASRGGGRGRGPQSKRVARAGSGFSSAAAAAAAAAGNAPPLEQQQRTLGRQDEAGGRRPTPDTIDLRSSPRKQATAAAGATARGSDGGGGLPAAAREPTLLERLAAANAAHGLDLLQPPIHWRVSDALLQGHLQLVPLALPHGAGAAAVAAATPLVEEEQVRCGVTRVSCSACVGRGWLILHMITHPVAALRRTLTSLLTSRRLASTHPSLCLSRATWCGAGLRCRRTKTLWRSCSSMARPAARRWRR